jgi:hypothetical protein
VPECAGGFSNIAVARTRRRMAAGVIEDEELGRSTGGAEEVHPVHDNAGHLDRKSSGVEVEQV